MRRSNGIAGVQFPGHGTLMIMIVGCLHVAMSSVADEYMVYMVAVGTMTIEAVVSGGPVGGSR